MREVSWQPPEMRRRGHAPFAMFLCCNGGVLVKVAKGDDLAALDVQRIHKRSCGSHRPAEANDALLEPWDWYQVAIPRRERWAK